MKLDARKMIWRELRNVCVLLDGADVSRDCFEVDDQEGWVRLYKRDRQGDLVRAGTTDIGPIFAFEQLHGQITILAMPRVPVPACGEVISIETVARYPSGDGALACYRCGRWVEEISYGRERLFKHTERIP